MELTYNSERPDLIIPEYGRNIQNMVQHAVSLEDREERNRCARAIITIMGQLFPHLRDVDDFKHKLWDHLFVMSEFELDVDSPYPKPSPETFKSKPRRLTYPQGDIRYGHYGKIVQNLIKKAADTEDEKERNAMALAIANLMKRSYLTWNRDSVKDEVIVNDLKTLSNGKLIISNPDLLVDTKNIVSSIKPANVNPKKRKSNRPRKKRN